MLMPIACYLMLCKKTNKMPSTEHKDLLFIKDESPEVDLQIVSVHLHLL